MKSGVYAAAALLAAAPTAASAQLPFTDGLGDGATTILGTAAVLAVMGAATLAILTTRRLDGSSLFNKLFVVVAVTSGFFSAVSSAIGFSLITSQETADFFRNAVLPPAFGVFVFFLSVAVWVGGAELVRHRDWFRGLSPGAFADAAAFVERAFKIFVVIPILAAILFVVSTWTTVVGIGGVDAVRTTYAYELGRLQSECAGIAAWRQRDRLFLEDLRISAASARAASARESIGAGQTGAAGQGPVADYIAGVAAWYSALEESVAATVAAPDPSGLDPYDPATCGALSDDLRGRLAANAYDNYDAWARDFETGFNDAVIVLNRWRRDRRVETLLDQQFAAFDRAAPKPLARRLSAGQSAAIDAYAEETKDGLRSLIRKQKSVKPPLPIASAAELSPERGLDIVFAWFAEAGDEVEDKKPARTQAVVEAETVAALSTITPRDAVLKHAQTFSDVWALGIAWDYAAYVLMLAYLFFPSAERAAGRKDG